jgi:hypothetical protein
MGKIDSRSVIEAAGYRPDFKTAFKFSLAVARKKEALHVPRCRGSHDMQYYPRVHL